MFFCWLFYFGLCCAVIYTNIYFRVCLSFRAYGKNLEALLQKYEQCHLWEVKQRGQIFSVFALSLLFFFGQACSVKCPSQWWNQSHNSDNTGSLTCWATRELLSSMFYFVPFRICLFYKYFLWNWNKFDKKIFMILHSVILLLVLIRKE